jgi:uncharacterized protein (DUF924 family)
MVIDELLTFWFGSSTDDAAVAKEKTSLWWSKNPAIDTEIRQRFENLICRAAAGELHEWQTNPRGRLALILLTDQFPRNIYRDSPDAFAYDSKALSWCLDGIGHGLDLKLRPIERVFFYLPLEHAESLECQDRSVDKFRELLDAADVARNNVFKEYFDFAVRHREIIARFGRFPHRNKILGRPSTPEELAFLEEPGSSF